MTRGGSKIVVVPWDQYMRDVKLLAKALIRKFERPSDDINLYGIPHGGAILALLLHYQEPEVFRICASTYDGPLVLVDDIIDSGATMKRATDTLFKRGQHLACVASLYLRTGCPEPPEVFVANYAIGIHVQFPYENERSTF